MGGSRFRWQVGRALHFLCAIAAILGVRMHDAAAADAAPTYVMKLSLATLNDSQHEWAKRFAEVVEQDSGGRIRGEIYPASQLGTTARQIESTQLGAIQVLILPPEFLAGVDERYEVMTASGLIEGPEHANRVISDPTLKKMFLALGADKGLVGISLFIASPAAILTRAPVRHLSDFKGLKIRVLASAFQNEQITRLGATPVAMSLADVMPALQQGAIDGSMAAVPAFAALHFYDAAKYMTETGEYFEFSTAVASKSWYNALPADLQKIILDDADETAQTITPWELTEIERQRQVWVAKGGELISLPPDEHAEMMRRLSTVGDDIANARPQLKPIYEAFVAAAKRSH